MNVKPTLKKPTPAGKNFDKKFNKSMNMSGVQLEELSQLEDEEEIDETTSMGGAAGADGISRGEKMSYVTPKAFAKDDDERNKKGVGFVQESTVTGKPKTFKSPSKMKGRGNYTLVDYFKTPFDDDLEDTDSAGGENSPTANSADGGAIGESYLFEDKEGMIADIVAKLGSENPEYADIEELERLGGSELNKLYQKSRTVKETMELDEDHLSTTKEKVDYLVDKGKLSKIDSVFMSDEEIDELYRDTENELNEKAVSSSQQKLMGMALAYKRGELENASDKVKELAKTMSSSDLEDFAKTKHTGIPSKVKSESYKMDEDYQEFFKSELEKTGKSLDDMSDEEKSEFFKEIDAKYVATNEGTNNSMAMKDEIEDAQSMALTEKRKRARGYKVQGQGPGGCRRGELPVPGTKEGEPGHCAQKQTLDKKNREKNKFNLKFRKERKTKREQNIDKSATSAKEASRERIGQLRDEIRAEKEKIADYLKTGKKMKKDDDFEMNEGRKPNALTLLDQIHSQNTKGTKEYMDSMDYSNMYKDLSEKIANLLIDYTKEKSYNDIYNEKSKVSELGNIGNNPSADGKNVVKRNETDDHKEVIALNRGEGMQDVKFDNKPSERYEEKNLKEPMGDDMYKQRQDKLDYKEKEVMYNKDPQPVQDYEKYKERFKNKISESASKRTYQGMYNEWKKKKIHSFNMNDIYIIPEGVQIDETFIPLVVDGMGNTIENDGKTVNESFKDMSINYRFYIKEGKVVLKPTVTQSINEDLLKKSQMLINHSPRKNMDTSHLRYIQTDFTKYLG